MKKRNLNCTIVLLFITYGNVFSQFNTLTRVQPKATIEQKLVVTESNPETKKKNKKSKLKNIFNITSKNELKQEIDSLKSMLNELKNKNSNGREDSMNSEIESEKIAEKKKSAVVYDFLEEPKSISKIVMPLNRKLTITSSYGSRTHPIFGTTKFHNGIDLAANFENVFAVMDGVVTEKGWDKNGGGYYLKIRHFNRFETAYLHLSEIYYRVGEKIKAGFIIAKSGNSGNSTGPHLHFSVKEFGQSINPSQFLNDLIKVNNLIALYNEK